MNIAVRYQSRGGNTKAIAEAVAKAAASRAESVEVPLNGPVDVLFIGGGVYASNIDESLQKYIDALNPEFVKTAAVFTTGGFMGATDKISAALKAKGINVCEKALPVIMLFKNFMWFRGKGAVKVSEKNRQLVDEFVKAAIQ